MVKISDLVDTMKLVDQNQLNKSAVFLGIFQLTTFFSTRFNGELPSWIPGKSSAQ